MNYVIPNIGAVKKGLHHAKSALSFPLMQDTLTLTSQGHIYKEQDHDNPFWLQQNVPKTSKIVSWSLIKEGSSM